MSFSTRKVRLEPDGEFFQILWFLAQEALEHIEVGLQVDPVGRV